MRKLKLHDCIVMEFNFVINTIVLGIPNNDATLLFCLTFATTGYDCSLMVARDCFNFVTMPV